MLRNLRKIKETDFLLYDFGFVETTVRNFCEMVVKCDGGNSLYELLWSDFRAPVRNILKEKVVFICWKFKLLRVEILVETGWCYFIVLLYSLLGLVYNLNSGMRWYVDFVSLWIFFELSYLLCLAFLDPVYLKIYFVDLIWHIFLNLLLSITFLTCFHGSFVCADFFSIFIL